MDLHVTVSRDGVEFWRGVVPSESRDGWWADHARAILASEMVSGNDVTEVTISTGLGYRTVYTRG